MSKANCDEAAFSARDARAHVAMELREWQVDRAWQRAEERTTRRHRAYLRPAVAGTMLTAAVVAALFTWPLAPRAVPQPESAALPAPASAAKQPVQGETPYRIELRRDGHVTRLAANAEATIHRLERGAAHFEVTPCKNDCTRRPKFVVLAESVRVEVVGTRFDVELQQGERGPVAVHVSVERGRVRVQHGDAEARLLQAGDRIRIPLPEAGTGHARSSGHAVGAKPAAKGGAGGREHGAREVFARARKADRAGDTARARRWYETILRDYPDDPRAGLAAYELGRILMDRMGDMAGAARQLERARRLAPQGPMADDATARLVRLYERTGALGRCRKLRERYLSEFPAGGLREDVKHRCH